MALRASPFPSVCVSWLHAVSWALVFPSFWLLDRLLACVRSTTREREGRREEECYYRPLVVLCGTLLFLALFLAWAPLGLLGFLLWAPLQAARRPFCYRQGVPSLAVDERNAEWRRLGRVSLGFATANLCLLPDGLARFNNLSDTQRRATAIGGSVVLGVTRPNIRIFVDSPSSCGTPSASSSLLSHNAPGPASYGATHTQAPPPADATNDATLEKATPPHSRSPASIAPWPLPVANSDQNSSPLEGGVCVGGVLGGGAVQGGGQTPPSALGPTGVLRADVPVEVSAMFPPALDFLCLQEVFDVRAAERLCASLAPLFGHVLYDVGGYACQPPLSCSAFKFFNSGLLLASRHPLVAAHYHCFPNARGEDALAAKGLLCAKVLLDLQDQGDQRMVGYLNCTHLHAPEGDGAVRYEQLTMVCKWIAEFQEKHTEEGDTVVFDVLCGDLNFDNTSPDDALEQGHSVFERYRDPCRAAAGQEKPWVIGTLLEQPTLYDEEVSSPDSLQRTLQDEALRRQFLSPPLAKGGVPISEAEGGGPWVGRRIDYLLYRDTTTHTEVEELTYITQLAGMTDHLPVALRLSVSPPPPTDPDPQF
ncbi:hypothetical protein ACEWY4_019353 [Coilia grayii]|uniref:sphingomyelin phosphodiesterase n=1 Tax=Coilia grayii TaxID=363190 RepID=A0ABD1JBZ2_9TELE